MTLFFRYRYYEFLLLFLLLFEVTRCCCLLLMLFVEILRRCILRATRAYEAFMSASRSSF
jgi:hypothetical protein